MSPPKKRNESHRSAPPPPCAATSCRRRRKIIAGRGMIFSLRTASFLRAAFPCTLPLCTAKKACKGGVQGRRAALRRKRYRLFGYKPHFRAAAGSPCRSRYRFARFGECGFYLKNTMHLLRILWNSSESLPHKADAHVGDVRELYYSLP